MRNDITDLMGRCKAALEGVKGQHWRRNKYRYKIDLKLYEIYKAGSEHIEEVAMKGFIASVEEFEKYVREQK